MARALTGQLVQPKCLRRVRGKELPTPLEPTPLWLVMPLPNMIPKHFWSCKSRLAAPIIRCVPTAPRASGMSGVSSGCHATPIPIYDSPLPAPASPRPPLRPHQLVKQLPRIFVTRLGPPPWLHLQLKQRVRLHMFLHRLILLLLPVLRCTNLVFVGSR